MTFPKVPTGQVVTLRFTIRNQDGVIEDVSAATAMILTIKKVGGAPVDKTLTFTGDGTDGQVKYTTLASDLDAPGIWRIQGKITLATVVYYTDLLSFEVAPNL
jgi:hypothetical protein